MTEMDARVIRTLGSGVVAIERATLTEGDSLTGLQAAVGGYVECFDVAHPMTGAIATLWFNDAGKMNQYDRNDMAEVVATCGGWAGLSWGDWIAGPVIVTGFDPEEGDTIALPEEWATLIERLVLDTDAVLAEVLAAKTEEEGK